MFLSSRTPVLVARDVKTFLPCTVNLDPKLREIIAGGSNFPSLEFSKMLLFLIQLRKFLLRSQTRTDTATPCAGRRVNDEGLEPFWGR